jgi:hypothetical protein
MTLTITAGTVRPFQIEFPVIPDAARLTRELKETIPDTGYLDDVHGDPAYRKHLTFHFAEEIRRELQQGGLT